MYLHTSARKHQDPDSLIAGVIRVVEKVNGMEVASGELRVGGWGQSGDFTKSSPRPSGQ